LVLHATGIQETRPLIPAGLRQKKRKLKSGKTDSLNSQKHKRPLNTEPRELLKSNPTGLAREIKSETPVNEGSTVIKRSTGSVFSSGCEKTEQKPEFAAVNLAPPEIFSQGGEFRKNFSKGKI
jgi:hypothetical protein